MFLTLRLQVYFMVTGELRPTDPRYRTQQYVYLQEKQELVGNARVV